MKQALCFFWIVSFSTLGFTSARFSDDFTSEQIRLLDGRTVSLEDYRGKKPVYLKFWASWCGSCLKQMPHFADIYRLYGDKVQIISINLGINDTRSDIDRVVKQYQLSMPTTMDREGALAETFKFVGSPYHLLFDKHLNLVHRGHESDENFDKKIRLLASGASVKPLAAGVSPSEHTKVNSLVDVSAIPYLSQQSEGASAILFTATWCDWYLKAFKPQHSKNCDASQRAFNDLAAQYPDISWMVVVSHFWTKEKDLAEYKEKYQVKTPSYIDETNRHFMQYKISHFPTLVVQLDGQVQYRTTQVQEDKRLVRELEALTRH